LRSLQRAIEVIVVLGQQVGEIGAIHGGSKLLVPGQPGRARVLAGELVQPKAARSLDPGLVPLLAAHELSLACTQNLERRALLRDRNHERRDQLGLVVDRPQPFEPGSPAALRFGLPLVDEHRQHAKPPLGAPLV
jgi:hypothetical protein